jgi:GTP-binding protein Era
VDTPGYQTEHPSALNRAMNRSVAAALEGVDAAVWVVEALRYDVRDEQVGKLLPAQVPVVLAINKTDAVKDRATLLPFISRLAGMREFVAIVPVSATRGWQTGELLDALAPLLPEGTHLHDTDDITTVHERVLAAELLREKVVRSLGDELPYAVMIEIDRFKQEGAMRRIHASIVVDKAGQKPIVIGKGGKTLKSIATRARRDMEALFGGKVFLEVWVKVRKGWADSEAVLKGLDAEA